MHSKEATLVQAALGGLVDEMEKTAVEWGKLGLKGKFAPKAGKMRAARPSPELLKKMMGRGPRAYEAAARGKLMKGKMRVLAPVPKPTPLKRLARGAIRLLTRGRRG